MLNAHFIAGDGRVNENIALTAIHQVFHSEHDRLVADIKNMLDHRHFRQPASLRLTQWQCRRRRTRAGTASASSRRHGS